MMIDSVVCVLNCNHAPINCEKLVSPETGETVFKTKFKTVVSPKYKDISAQIKTVARTVSGYDEASHLVIKGNPNKFINGHNIFGSPKIVNTVIPFLIEVMSLSGIEVTADIKDHICRGNFKFKEIDINTALFLNSHQEVHRYLETGAGIFSTKGRSETWNHKTTWYVGKQGKNDYKLIRIYNKYQEAKDKQWKSNCSISSYLEPSKREELLKYADGILRFEVSLRRRWLEKSKLSMGYNWIEQGNLERIINTSLDSINMPTNINLTSPERYLDTLQKKELMLYSAWYSSGPEFAKSTVSRATFSKHRRSILSLTGTDISKPRSNLNEPLELVPRKQRTLPEPHF